MIKKRVCRSPVLWFAILSIMFSLSACSPESTVTTDEQDTLEHINETNTYGYYLDVYTSQSKDQERNGIIDLDALSDIIYFQVESAGVERQLSVQVFVDYVQVPIIIGDTEYDTFIINASESYSKEFGFTLANSIDTNYNHTLLVSLSVETDSYATQEDVNASNDYSLALNHILSFNQNNPLFETMYNYEDTEIITNYSSSGLLINTDIENHSRKIDEEIRVSAGEEFALQYQVGGYEDCESVAIIVSVGLEQAEINNQEYILCEVKSDELVGGEITLLAPDDKGFYEIMGCVVKNPFDIDMIEYIPLDISYRFTLIVE